MEFFYFEKLLLYCVRTAVGFCKCPYSKISIWRSLKVINWILVLQLNLYDPLQIIAATRIFLLCHYDGIPSPQEHSICIHSFLPNSLPSFSNSVTFLPFYTISFLVSLLLITLLSGAPPSLLSLELSSTIYFYPLFFEISFFLSRSPCFNHLSTYLLIYLIFMNFFCFWFNALIF